MKILSFSNVYTISNSLVGLMLVVQTIAWFEEIILWLKQSKFNTIFIKSIFDSIHFELECEIGK